MRTGSIQLARVFGIRIGASPSWFVVALIFIVWLSTAYDDQYGQTTGYLMAVVSVGSSSCRSRCTSSATRGSPGATASGSPASTCGSSAASRSSPATPSRRARSSASARPDRRSRRSSWSSPARGAPGRRHDDFVDALFLRDDPGPALAVLGLAGPGQRRALRLQPDPRLPARRRAHRQGDRVEAHRRPQPRHALLRPPRPGLLLHPHGAGHLPARPRRRGQRDLVDPHGLVPGPVRDRRGRLEPLLRAPARA